MAQYIFADAGVYSFLKPRNEYNHPELHRSTVTRYPKRISRWWYLECIAPVNKSFADTEKILNHLYQIYGSSQAYERRMECVPSWAVSEATEDGLEKSWKDTKIPVLDTIETVGLII